MEIKTRGSNEASTPVGKIKYRIKTTEFENLACKGIALLR